MRRFPKGALVRRQVRRHLNRAGAVALVAAGALLWCCVGEPRCGCDAGPEWTAPADASHDTPGACSLHWWSKKWEPTLDRDELADQARTLGYTCPKAPADYQRVLSSEELPTRTPEEREAWARQVFDLAADVLLDEAGDTVCAAPTWKPGPQGVTAGDGVLRYDGTFGVGDGARVPAYLLLPLVSAGAPFAPRAAAVVIHGHDGGRIEVVERPEGYQKAMALRLAQAGYVVLAADNVSWGTHHPLGSRKPNHGKDFALYMKPGSANGLITWNLTDLFHGVTLLAGVHVARNPKADRWEVAAPGGAGATPAVNAVAVSGLSYGAQVAAYMALDPRPSAYIVSSGLIDTCDVLQNDHHKCQLIKPFQGVITIWDLIVANALLERPRLGLGVGRPAVLVAQGLKDKILRAWGKHGIEQLQKLSEALELDTLEVAISKTEGHTYLVEPTLDFLRRHLPLP